MFFYDWRIGRKIFSANKINDQTDHHSDASNAEAPVPADSLTQCADDKGCDDDATIDKEVVDLVGVRPTIVAG